jgi:hypothetical protein
MYHARFHDGHSHDGYGHGYHDPTSGHTHPGLNKHVYGPSVPISALNGQASAPNTPLVVRSIGGDFHPFSIPISGNYLPKFESIGVPGPGIGLQPAYVLRQP